MLNSTAIASGYASRDPQGGLAIKAFKVCIELFVKKKRKFFFVLRNENEKERVRLKLKRKR